MCTLFIIIIIILGCFLKPVRKAAGLLLIILGIFECLSVIGIIIGIISIFIGGILLFS
jgi:hypothetical protein